MSPKNSQTIFKQNEISKKNCDDGNERREA